MAATTLTLTRNALLAPRTTLAATSPAPPPAPAPRTRPYKDYLTPALHRRFTHAAITLLGACYITSLLLSPPSLLWIWNPLSPATLRALLLFMPCLAVFIIRVANMHCGNINTASHAEWIWATVTGFKGWHTLAWYLFSALFFAEVYVWSRSEDAGLAWVDKGRAYERARVNENPLFLRAVFVCMAVAQTFLHLSRDEDRIPVPEKDEDPIAAAQRERDGPRWKVPASVKELGERMPVIAGRVAKLAIPGFAFTLPVYFILLRPMLWPVFYSITRTFHRSLPPNARPTGLQHVMTTLPWQAITSSSMLISLWELSSTAFTIFVARPPLAKTGVDTLTGGLSSKDPNGSLLSGLRSKKEVPRTFAFWELSLICQFFDARRKTIYTEVDRATGSTWTQICGLCIDDITAIQTRIKAFQQQSLPAPAPAPSHHDLLPPSQQPQPLGMPRIADRGVLANGALTTEPPSTWDRKAGNLAKSLSQSPGSPGPLVPRIKSARDWTAAQGLSRDNLNREAGGMLQTVLRSPVGEALRQTFARRVRAAVFGREGRGGTAVFASRALATLCAKSLKEDDFGQVAKSVALVIRTYVETIAAIQTFVRDLRPHWSDVEFSARDREVEDVQALVAVLRQGLEEVVLAFGEYASSVGVSKKELREAREVVAGVR